MNTNKSDFMSYRLSLLRQPKLNDCHQPYEKDCCEKKRVVVPLCFHGDLVEMSPNKMEKLWNFEDLKNLWDTAN